MNVSFELTSKAIKPKRIKLERIKGKLIKPANPLARKTSPTRPVSQAVKSIREKRVLSKCELGNTHISKLEGQPIETDPLEVMKKSAQGFYKRAGTAGATNSRNTLGGGFRSAMSNTNRRLLLNMANHTTTAQSRNVDQVKGSVQPYGLDTSDVYSKFTNNEKVRRYYKGCTEKLE